MRCLALDGSARGDERLRGDLAAEEPRTALAFVLAAEDVEVDGFEVETREQLVELLACRGAGFRCHAPMFGHGTAFRIRGLGAGGPRDRSGRAESTAGSTVHASHVAGERPRAERLAGTPIAKGAPGQPGRSMRRKSRTSRAVLPAPHATSRAATLSQSAAETPSENQGASA